jgi:hypothetical protein
MAWVQLTFPLYKPTGPPQLRRAQDTSLQGNIDEANVRKVTVLQSA